MILARGSSPLPDTRHQTPVDTRHRPSGTPLTSTGAHPASNREDKVWQGGNGQGCECATCVRWNIACSLPSKEGRMRDSINTHWARNSPHRYVVALHTAPTTLRAEGTEQRTKQPTDQPFGHPASRLSEFVPIHWSSITTGPNLHLVPSSPPTRYLQRQRVT